MSEAKEPRLPNVGEYVRHHGTLVAIEDVPPPPQPPPKKDYIFEDITARKELRLNGETVKVLETLTDFYGLETSVKTAIEEAKEFAKRKQIGPASDLEVVVIRVVDRVRMRPKVRENFYDKTFCDFESASKYGSSETVSETIAWSSNGA